MPKTEKAVWTPEMVTFLVDYLDAHKGGDGPFIQNRREACGPLLRAMNETLKGSQLLPVSQKQVDTKIQSLRDCFNKQAPAAKGYRGPVFRCILTHGKAVLHLKRLPNAGSQTKKTDPPSEEDSAADNTSSQDTFFDDGGSDYAPNDTTPEEERPTEDQSEKVRQAPQVEVILSDDEEGMATSPPALNEDEPVRKRLKLTLGRRDAFGQQSETMHQESDDYSNQNDGKIRVDMTRILKKCAQATEERLRASNVNAFGPVNIDPNNLNDSIRSLLFTIFYTDDADLKQELDEFVERQAKTALPRTIFIESLLGAAIHNWVLMKDLPTSSIDLNSPHMYRRVKAIVGEDLTALQQAVKHAELDKLQEQIPHLAGTLAMDFERVVASFSTPASDTEVEHNRIFGVFVDDSLPGSWSDPDGWYVDEDGQTRGRGNMDGVAPRTFVPVRNSKTHAGDADDWYRLWKADLILIFRWALKLRIDMERMDAEFDIRFPLPGTVVLPVTAEGLEMPAQGAKTCMIGLGSGIYGRFRNPATGELGPRIVCSSVSAFISNAEQQR